MGIEPVEFDEFGFPRSDDARMWIRGDWEVLRDTADAFDRIKVEVGQAQDRLKPLEKKEMWQGSAADGFVKDVGTVRGVLELLADELPPCAGHMRQFGETLRFAQGECANDLIPKVRRAEAASRAHDAQMAQYKTAKDQWDTAKKAGADESCLPPKPTDPGKNPGKGDLEDAHEQYRRVWKRVSDDEARRMLKLREHLDRLQNVPDLRGAIKTFVKEFVKGAITGTWDLASAALQVSPTRLLTDPAAYFTDMKNTATSFYDLATHPTQFKDLAVQSWEDFRANPGKFLGEQVPNLALSGGTGAGRKILTPAEKLEKDIAKKDNPGCRGADGCTREGEPIDVVTGEMVLTQTDVTLPGTLPLVLERQHRTAFDGGRWYGEHWASTLDQHLELGPEWLRFTAADGMRLRYRAPRPGEPTLPVGGYRWPLEWDGTPTGAFTVTDPQRGWTWSFAPLPGAASRRIPVRSLHDRNGNRIDYAYDDNGVPCEVTHSGGYRIAVDSEAGLITGLRLLNADPETHARTDDRSKSTRLLRFGYDEAGDLTSVTNSSGKPLRFTYDTRRRITSWTDRNNTWYQYAYDEAGRCVHSWGTDGILDNTFEYDVAARTTRMTDALGAVRKYEYNDWSQVVRETDPLGGTRHTEWDSYNRRVAVTDELGHTTRYVYDPLGNTIGIVLPNGTFTVADFDPLLCRPTLVTGPDGGVRRYTYDERGNRLTGVDELGAVTSYRYDEAGHMSAVTNALGHATHIASDAAGLPLAVTDPLGATTTVTRNAFGRGVIVTNPVGGITHTAWTTEGKPAWRERPDGTRELWSWDGEGNLRHYINPAGFTTSYESTHFDLPAAQTGPDGARLEFAYDAELRLTQVTNPQGLTWEYEYDPMGRLIAETDFNGRELTYRHDAAGRLSMRINGAGESLAYTRDTTGRVVTQRHEVTGRETTYRHDAAGRLVRATNPDVDLLFTRDATGRITAETSNGRTLSNTYDAVGRRIRRKTPSGQVSHWSYDAAGRPAALGTGAHSLTFTHDQAGREIRRRLGDRVTFRQEWDQAHRLTAQSTTVGDSVSKLTAVFTPDAGPREIHRRTYGYRADGCVMAIDDTATGTKAYDLDEVGRITAVHGRGWTEHYAYDSAGNQANAIWPAEDTDTQGRRDVVGTLIHRAGRTHYFYDAQGRMVRQSRKTLSGKTKTWIYRWDAEDRLTDVETPDGSTWCYTYDPLARRTSKARRAHSDDDVSGDVVFAWDDTCLAESKEPGGRTTSWDYEVSTHRILAQTVRNPDPDDLREDLFHVISTDSAGTPVQCVDSSGSMLPGSRRSIWGISESAADDVDLLLHFPGQYDDVETGLRYNLYRYYQPETARYGTADPLGLTSAPNIHSYVSNPLRSSDPLGLMECRDLGDDWVQRPASDIPNSSGCEVVARQIQERIGGDIITINPVDQMLLPKYRGQDAGWFHHVVVVRDGRVYDAFTGKAGEPIEQWKNEWSQHGYINFGF
jgi:RHS repeat-associated protein